MMMNSSTFSMGRALIFRVYIRHLQKPAAVIIFHSDELVHHIDGLYLYAFVQKEGQQLIQLFRHPRLQHPNTAHDRGL
jgi:hypothetical protein